MPECSGPSCFAAFPIRVLVTHNRLRMATEASAPRRKLSVILMVDVSGFSRMMGRNEERTTALIREFHAQPCSFERAVAASSSLPPMICSHSAG